MTWEQKIENLITLAQAVGRYTHAEKGTDYYNDARRKLLEAYEDFCQWRHDEPYIIDELKALVGQEGEYTDTLTGTRLIVEQHNPEYPGYPKLTVICPKLPLSFEELNKAVVRLEDKAGIEPACRMSPLLWQVRGS